MSHSDDSTLPAPHAHTLTTWTRERALDLGCQLAQRAAERGLAVTQSDATVLPIPIGALPVILSHEDIAVRRTLAQHLVSATAKAARWRLSGPDRESVLNALSATERRMVEATYERPAELAVARVDFLMDARPQALEVNATIPAMQGYSDIAAEAWLETFAAGRDDLGALIAANGSNTQALLHALVELHAARRRQELAIIGLLCRRGDAQLTELHYLQNRFRDAGFDARIVHPDELVLRRGYLEHAGQPLQLVYRHLFVSRLEQHPSPAIEAALLARDGRGTLILNAPSPHLEMKSTLALLSQTRDSPWLADAIGLDDAERRSIRESVPWTRSLYLDGRGDSEERRELLREVSADPDAYVLKRSWSYGGNEVFVGRAHHTADFWSRVHATFPDIDRWADLCARAARDRRGGGFVVQRAIARVQSEQFLCTPTSIQRAQVTTDYAAYASIGTAPAWSGVCRAAASDIVNIVGGGAVVPIIRRDVADRLMRLPV